MIYFEPLDRVILYIRTMIKWFNHVYNRTYEVNIINKMARMTLSCLALIVANYRYLAILETTQAYLLY